MEISFSSNSITDDHVATKFGTCHDSPAVVPCAKYCSDHLISFWMRAKWNFHHIWIVMEKLLVKWAPESYFTRARTCCSHRRSVSTEINHSLGWQMTAVGSLWPLHAILIAEPIENNGGYTSSRFFFPLFGSLILCFVLGKYQEESAHLLSQNKLTWREFHCGDLIKSLPQRL